jgi:hypothetical protein
VDLINLLVFKAFQVLPTAKFYPATEEPIPAMAPLLPRWSDSPSYNHLSKQEEPFLQKGQDELSEDGGQIILPERTIWWSSKPFLLITNALFASLSFYLYLTQRQHITYSPSLGSYEEGFTTELAAVRGQIALETRMFYGAPTWSKDGVGSLLFDPNGRVFFGNATDEMDDNWENFIGSKLLLNSLYTLRD